jgi:circadian clock protein KaiC
MHKQIDAFKPSVVIIDPVTNMMTAGLARDARSVLLRLIDYLKGLQITVFMNSLTHDGNTIEQSEVEISSLIDTWLFVRDIELGGERNRGMYILKSRGMAHSNQIREFVLGRQGIELVDVYLGPAGVLTGSARIAQAAKEHALETAGRRDLKRQQAEMLSKRKAFEAQIAALQAQILAQDQATEHLVADTQANESRGHLERRAMALSRKADSGGGRTNGKESRK